MKITPILMITALVAFPAHAESDWTAKVDPWVLDHGRSQSVEFLVMLGDQADLANAKTLASKVDKGRHVFETLSRKAKATQAPILAELTQRGIEHRSFWIANMIWVRGDRSTAELMARRADVAHVFANPKVALDVLPRRDTPPATKAPTTVEWNIALVGAPDVWADGVTGEGAVVAGQDTGYLWSHPALVNQYRGGPAGDHAYNWHDAIHSGGGSCGADSPVPCDDHGHGTHTMGTMVGDDGGTNQVGMAPGARWIGCRNMDQGAGTPATYAECYQWFIAPTDLADENPDPSKAPDVINNSWGCPPSEGCTDPGVLLAVVQAVRAAGIVTVHSAGNDGSGCSTVSEPAAIYGESFSVGATTSSDTIASFSSRGPVTIDGSNRMKPDISAPGSNIRSSTRDGGYEGGWSGTSMAGPHVAGLVALVLSGAPGIAGDVDLVEEIIDTTAAPLTTSQGCGGDASDAVPNNVFGWGRIDAWAAHTYPLDYQINPNPTTTSVCAPADAIYQVAVDQFQGFSENVVLSANGLPAGATAAFGTNPVTPPGSSQLTVSNTTAIGPGDFTFDIDGSSSPSGVSHSSTVSLVVSDQAPGAVTLTTPADGAVDVALLPTLSWQTAAQAVTYAVEVDDEPSFATPVATATTATPTTTLETSLAPETTYWWRVRGDNACGQGVNSATRSFTTRAIPPVLLVDDDDNSPDVRATYTTTLDGLGLAYDVWDTANTDNEPSAAELAPYRAVVWFSGDEFGGAAGPGSAGEAALDSWLGTPDHCLLISAQDYFYDRGLTSFMENRLGLGAATSDTDQVSVTGAGSMFTGMGPFTLAYPFSDYADTVSPASGAEMAFTGSSGGAAVQRVGPDTAAVFMAFPFEALPTTGDRQAVLSTLFSHCLGAPELVFADDFESGTTTMWTTSAP